MFSEQNNEMSKLSETELLSQYKHNQDVVRQYIGQRKYAELMSFMSSPSRNAKALEEASQSGVEGHVTELGRLREEIEKRGIQVPTMEEQDQQPAN